jgi:signal transduction histidine kinase
MRICGGINGKRMRDATGKIRQSARPATLLAVGTAAFFLTLALVIYELDRQHYMNEKHQIIRDGFQEIFRLPDTLNDQAREVLFGSDRRSREAAAERLRRLMTEVVSGPTSIYRMTLFDPEKQAVMEVAAPEKPKRLNSWRNNLILRSFDGMSDMGITRPYRPEGGLRQSGRLQLHFSTPAGHPLIEALTARYRLYLLGLVVLWCCAYYFLYKYLLRPLRNVVAYVERSKLEGPRFIPRASGMLEQSYNDMARQALLHELQERLGTLVRCETRADRQKIWEEALGTVRDAYGVSGIQVAEFSGEPGRLNVVESVSSQEPGTEAPPDLNSRVDALLGGGSLGESERRFEAGTDGSIEYLARIAQSYFLVVARLRAGLPDSVFRLEGMRQTCETLRRSFEALRLHEQDILRQRSEANIVLSKNLGHDLTNIIATAKLDLLALKQMIGNPESLANGQRSALLGQSVAGLLENTRFLQEIVNIYRSFSYVKRPQFERQHLNDLVTGFLQAFQPSMSSRVTFRCELQEGMATLILEPRLLKLALFNVLTNAMDAFKRDARDDRPEPVIVIRTAQETDKATYRVEIEDNGPGIRDDRGQVLGRAEIDAIFQHGYSTKPESSEGLGLNWVRTIVEEFHGGAVRAENVDSGGARFILTLKSMDAAEARIA